MPVRRSVLAIDVDDASFKEHLDAFDKYREAVSRLPGIWKKSTEEVKATSGIFADVVAAMLTVSEALRKAEYSTDSIGRTAGIIERTFTRVGHATGTVAHNLAQATKSLISWSTMVTGVGGLIGIGGGLWGLEHLAGSAASTRRGALGLGVSGAAYQSFPLALGRIFDPSFLPNVFTAMSDVSKRYSLYGAGLSEGQITRRPASDVALDLIPLLKRAVDSAPEGQLTNVLQARGLSNLISLTEAERLRNTPANELNKYIAQQRQLQAELALPPGTREKWQEFNFQLSRAGGLIENALIEGLVKLTDPLSKLSEDFVDLARDILKSDGFAYAVDAVSDGLKHLDSWAKSFSKADVDEFMTHVKTAAGHVREFASEAVAATKTIFAGVKWVKDHMPDLSSGLTDPTFNPVTAPLGAGIGSALGSLFGPIGALVGGWLGFRLGGGVALGTPRYSGSGLPSGVMPGGDRGASAAIPPPPGAAHQPSLWERIWHYVNPVSAAHGAPMPGFAGATGAAAQRTATAIRFFEGQGLTHDQAVGVTARLYAESGGLDPNAVNHTSGAYGIAQWLGSRKPPALATHGDFMAQLRLVWYEFTHGEASAFRAVQAAHTPHDAAVAMEKFERAGNPAFTRYAAALAERLARQFPAEAHNIWNQFRHWLSGHTQSPSAATAASTAPPAARILPTSYHQQPTGGVPAGTPGAGASISREMADRMNADARARGDTNHLPVMPTQYVFGRGMAPPPSAGRTSVDIHVNNNTGGSAVISNNQVGAGML